MPTHTATPSPTNTANRAVVLGGSIAGLLAARVLADHVDEVLIVDRDELPTSPGHRRGVPQDRHAHALLATGRQLLEQLLPGLTDELVARGAPTGDLLGDARVHLSGHRLARTDSGLLGVMASRTLLEDQVRRRVRALDNVVFAPPSDALGLVVDDSGERIAGVRVLERSDNSAEEVVDAGFVIDATGRGTRSPQWLAAVGFTPPAEDRVTLDVGYASRCFRARPGDLGGDVATIQGPYPGQPRGGFLTRIEGDRWLTSLVGIDGDHPPTDPAGFMDFARSLQFPDLYKTIRDAPALDDPVAYRFPANVRRRWESLRHPPVGFVPLGDSVASFNPAYGQGMTVAALQAMALERYLADDSAPDPAPLMADLAAAVDDAWKMATGADLGFPRASGNRTLPIRLAGAWIPKIHAAAEREPALARTWMRLHGLVDGPAVLFRPDVVLRVLTHRWRRHDNNDHDYPATRKAPINSGAQ